MERTEKVHKAANERPCPVCGRPGAERVRTLTQRYMGIQYMHILEAHISVCKNCGFLFASPAAGLAELNEYYSDMSSLFEPESSYSVGNRLALIRKYAKGRRRIAEIGGNAQGGFKKELERIFESYDSYDVNDAYGNTVTDLKDLSEVDMIVGYHVMEHVLEVNEMAQACHGKLSPGGIFIIEVPDANSYYLDTNALLLTEHVNHFTPQSLARLMGKNRFKLLEISRAFTSRSSPSSFAAVFQKQADAVPVCPSQSDYAMAKSLLLEGLRAADAERQQFARCIDMLYQKFFTHSPEVCSGNKAVAFWCANNTLIPIIDEFLHRYHAFDALIIDEDSRKQDFYLDYSARTSKQAWESGAMGQIRYLVICSGVRVQGILSAISQYPGNGKLEVYYIDGAWNLMLCRRDSAGNLLASEPCTPNA